MENDFWEYEPVPPSAIRLFRMSWQLEAWLGQIVYVELRAADGNWESRLEKLFKDNLKRIDKDKKLHHMATVHQSRLMYLTLHELWVLVSDSDSWALFEPYFPPQSNVTARIDEVKAIRNRVAHSREPHANDVARMELFLRDLELGFGTFCRRYADREMPFPLVSQDGVAKRLEVKWKAIGHCTELFAPSVGWLYAPEPFTTAPKLGGKLERLPHPADTGDDGSGLIYRLTVQGIRGWQLDVRAYVESTQRFKENIIHWMIPDEDEVLITVPAVLGDEAVCELIGNLLQGALNSVVPGEVPNYRKWTKQKSWPEHVLLPNHPLMVAGLNEGSSIFDLA